MSEISYTLELIHSPSSLDDVHPALGYYLRHRDEVEAYLRQQEAEAEAFRQAYEREHPPKLTWAILLERLEAKRKTSGE
jgi:hypothetical protein